MVTTTMNVGQAAKLLNAKKTSRTTAPVTPPPAQDALTLIMNRLAALEAENAALKARPASKPTTPAATEVTQTGWALVGTEMPGTLANGKHDPKTPKVPLLVVARTMSDGTTKRGWRIGASKVGAILEFAGDKACKAVLDGFVKAHGAKGDE